MVAFATLDVVNSAKNVNKLRGITEEAVLTLMRRANGGRPACAIAIRRAATVAMQMLDCNTSRHTKTESPESMQ